MTRRTRWRALAIAAAIAAALVGAAGLAEARPGGGDSFSGGGGHSGSGGSSGDSGLIFELLYWGIRLIFWYPSIGLPILGLVIGYVIYSAYRQQRNKDWDSGPPVELHQTIELGELRRLDAAFSQVVFEDFAFRLFSTAHRARHTTDALAAVAPYISEAARGQLASRAPVGEPVVQVVVGALPGVSGLVCAGESP